MRSFSLAVALLLSPMASVWAEEAAAPSRVVSIGGAVTEILYALGQESRVVGVDTTSLFPPEALGRKPNVGYMRALSAEGVLSLSPDLVLMDEGAGPKEAVALLDASGVRVEHVPTGHSVAELHEKVVKVASVVGNAAKGEEMANRIDGEFASLAASLGQIERKRRVLFILSLVDGRPNAAGSDTGADAVIRLAGAENVFGDVKGYKTLSTEALAALAPDVILLVSRAGPSNAPDPMSVPALAATPAGQSGAVIRMDAAYLLGFGPRTPAAVRDLAAKLYPEKNLLAAGAR
ncbi:heme/hemin ABC transporter substrate-binding protein [Aureimonas psammosilenae]|uniref:heme/hemin ABC transporter substrate-binding protein n=1 Tax=Aureimonas psammosilenae TaxID=2495496 RepID=UPI0012610EE3|nr:ABC transporter substrate-binding protein [Aureimonas psammosilenae]